MINENNIKILIESDTKVIRTNMNFIPRIGETIKIQSDFLNKPDHNFKILDVIYNPSLSDRFNIYSNYRPWNKDENDWKKAVFDKKIQVLLKCKDN